MTEQTISIPEFSVPLTQKDDVYSDAERDAAFQRIGDLLAQNNAAIIAHFYVDADIQALAQHTGGFVGDSLAMAQFGMQSSADTLVVAGVRFMGETAKILSPEKTVLMPTLKAECSLDLSCPADQFQAFCDQHPDRTVVVYANTSAEVKAIADWVVTSSNALEIVSHLHEKGEKIIWASDRYLGGYIEKQTGADMLLWQGSCIVHEEFRAQGLQDLIAQYPNAAVLVHPESPAAVTDMADVVGSTSRLLKAVREMDNDTFIVATDRGIFFQMQQDAPDKTLVQAPTAGHGATCRSCGHCPWMAMNQLANLEQVLREGGNQIFVKPEVIEKAKVSLGRMVEFSEKVLK